MFTRNGTLSPVRLIALLLFMVGDANRKGYRHLLDSFWDQARSSGISLPTKKPVSGAAFCTARHKIPFGFVRTLLHQAADRFEAAFGSELRWFGRRVFAIDGLKVNRDRFRNAIYHHLGGLDLYPASAMVTHTNG